MFNLYENSTFRSVTEENKPINYLNTRQDIHRILQFLGLRIVKTCGYRGRCYFCNRYCIQYNELTKKGFYSFQKDVIYWDVRNPEFNSKNEIYKVAPVFKFED